MSRQFSKATQIKQEIEETQRVKAKKRQELGLEWKPRFFKGSVTPLGKPELTDEGIKALKGLQEGKWRMEVRKEPGVDF